MEDIRNIQLHGEMPAERFMRYARMDTQSDASSESSPSTHGQRLLANRLASELATIGIEDAEVDRNGYLYATIPATAKAPDGTELPCIGFVSHLDTSPASPGADVKPQVHTDYQGGPLPINVEEDITLLPSTSPDLVQYVGCDIITSDGTTLLGSDDKSGVAAIMSMADTLVHNSSIAHPKIRIAFTPDEELGRSFDHFDISKFGVDFAYTVDGDGPWNRIEGENFNAAEAKVSIKGISVHPGSAKGAMVNAIQVAMDFHSMLPADERPENTSGYQGFFMLEHISGSIEHAEMTYIIRDHNRRKFDAKKQMIQGVVRAINDKYGEGTCEAEVKDEYYNMRDTIEKHPQLLENAAQAIRELGGEAISSPIRGGTDGSFLCAAGLPCPNLSCGGHNFHGRREFVAVQSIEKVAMLLVRLAELSAERPPA